MIKVCHITNIITGRADGVYAHLKMIFRNYDKSKFEHCLIFHGGEKIERELIAMGIKVFVSSSLNKKVPLKAFIDIIRIIKENNIDIIHTHLNKSYVIGGMANIFLRRKFIYNYHGLFLANSPYYNFMELIIYRICHLLIYFFGVVNTAIVPSERSRQLLMKETKLFPEPVVYYNGFDTNDETKNLNTELYNRLKIIKEEKTVIAVIGRLEIDKQINKAIKVFRNVFNNENKVHLLIFGDGKLEPELRRLIDELNVTDNIEIQGFVEEIKNYYGLFDIIFFTSRWEGMPLVIWEAMAKGIPVIAPDVGGFKEILELNNCGLIYEPGNIKEAEEKLLRLIIDPQFRNELGENGMRSVNQKYNSQSFIKHIENIYINMCR